MTGDTIKKEPLRMRVGKRLDLYKTLLYSVKKVFMSSPGIFTVTTVVALANALSSFVLMYCGRELVNAVSTQEALSAVAGWIVLSVAITVGLVFVNFFSSLLKETQQLRFSQYINTEMARKVVSLDISHFDNDRYYDLIEQANNGKSQINGLYDRGLGIAINIVMAVVSTAMTVQSANVWVPAVVIVFTLPPLFTQGRYLKKQFDYGIKTQNLMRRVSYLAGVIMGRNTAKEVRFYHMSDFVVDKYKQHWNEYITGMRKIIVRYGLGDSFFNIFPMIGIAVSMYVVLQGIINGRNQIGDFIYLLGLFMTLRGSFSSLVGEIARLGETSYSIEKYYTFMNMQPIVINTGTQKLHNLETVEFKDVSFTYPLTERPVINHMNFCIKGHEKVAIVGVNGAGKSTLVKLLLRFYDIDKGQILINGVDIKEYDLDSLREGFSTVFQDYVTYSFSIRDNVAMSDYENRNNDERIKAALILSELEQGILDKSDSLDVDITRDFSEDGLELSGGQRQKLAIARGAFRQAPMVILDEPTASLDPVAEYEILQQFNKLTHKRGLIMISHRLSNTTMLDRVMVVERGTVLENGSHNELMRLNGRYAHLFNLQASKFMEEAAGL